jgi:dTDP-glucose 4,6-dehydratase
LNTLLITGGYGFIGSHFIRLLRRVRPQWRMVNIDLLTYAGNVTDLSDLNFAPDDSGYRFVQGDIANSSLVRQIFERRNRMR